MLIYKFFLSSLCHFWEDLFSPGYVLLLFIPVQLSNVCNGIVNVQMHYDKITLYILKKNNVQVITI